MALQSQVTDQSNTPEKQDTSSPSLSLKPQDEANKAMATTIGSTFFFAALGETIGQNGAVPGFALAGFAFGAGLRAYGLASDLEKLAEKPAFTPDTQGVADIPPLVPSLLRSLSAFTAPPALGAMIAYCASPQPISFTYGALIGLGIGVGLVIWANIKSSLLYEESREDQRNQKDLGN